MTEEITVDGLGEKEKKIKECFVGMTDESDKESEMGEDEKDCCKKL